MAIQREAWKHQAPIDRDAGSEGGDWDAIDSDRAGSSVDFEQERGVGVERESKVRAVIAAGLQRKRRTA